MDEETVAASWFSCMIRTASVIDGAGLSSEEKSVFVFRALSWPDARRIATSLGRSRDRTYENSAGRRVRIAFKELATLDELGALEPEGREVYSEANLVETADASVAFDVEFHPEDSDPKQTGV